MAEITKSMNAQQICNLLNEALAEFNVSAGLSADMTAAAFCDAVNDAFDDAGVTCDVTQSMTNEQLVSALNVAIDDLDSIELEDNTIRFLHISDMHGITTPGTTEVERLLAEKVTVTDADSGIETQEDKYSHLFVTGDIAMASTGGSLANVITWLKKDNVKLKTLLVAGNHDLCDNTHSASNGYSGVTGYTQAAERSWQDSYQGDRVNFGVETPNSSNGYGCYWYKDIESGSKIIRVIGLDQYECGTTGVSDGNNKSRVGYTQKQIEWLCGLLSRTPSSHYLLFLTHEPPCQTPIGLNPSVTTPDPTAQCVRPTKGIDDTNANAATNNKQSRLFISEHHFMWHNVRPEGSDINILPRILRAYLHRGSVTFNDYTNALAPAGTINYTADFTGISNPAKLIGWVCGHMHNDYVGYIPDAELESTPTGWENGWGDQLVMGICAFGSVTPWSEGDDLHWNINWQNGSGEQWATNEPTYRINEYAIDFKAKTITVKRYGNKTTAEYGSTNNMNDDPPKPRAVGQRVRDEVVFPLTKKIN